ncbi:hypothetical protein R1sor_014895 [Riccia sorocarpa]|uniref:Uncharacterized protein n=1 Tax=Riccia sorocarpa TaxID=122646 RepID=A0ABD3HEX8_9MARC
MGSTPSKKIEETLETSSTFQAAVDASYEECMILSQHMFPGLPAWQLLNAVQRIYEKLTAEEEEKDEDAVLMYKEKWLPQPPGQIDVDRAIRKEKLFTGDKRFISQDEFRLFATTLFRDMGLTTACYRLAVYVPVSSISVLCAHLIVKKLPLVGPAYRAGGPLMPGLLLGSIVGVVVSQLRFT